MANASGSAGFWYPSSRGRLTASVFERGRRTEGRRVVEQGAVVGGADTRAVVVAAACATRGRVAAAREVARTRGVTAGRGVVGEGVGDVGVGGVEVDVFGRLDSFGRVGVIGFDHGSCAPI